MKVFKDNIYALFLIVIVAVLVTILIMYNEELGSYTPVFSAVIGALSGSLGAYIVSTLNGSAEKRKARRRILYLLKVTHETFGYIEVNDSKILHGKFIYDDKWPDYIAYLDDQLSFEEIVRVVDWFNALYLLEETLKEYNGEHYEVVLAYQTAQAIVIERQQVIKEIIEKLESK
ncbi:hypothetical protein [Priestia aryabhattai]|uniref:hypothetical protein n=1 Tax=Priestia aryabhattai TaxID=412384 RepID=UPI003C98A703